MDDHHLTETPSRSAAHLTAVPAPAPRVALAGQPALIDRPWPIWRLVLFLAWPALLQQALLLSVNLSDRVLAGRFAAAGTLQ